MQRLAFILLFPLATLVSAFSHSASPSISAGTAHSVALKSDGTVRTWGDDSAGQLGAGRPVSSAVPIPIPSAAGAAEIAVGFGHILMRKGDGSLWAWGDNSFGQLGDGTTIEARSSALGVVSSNTTGRSFTTAALVPSARYGAAPGPTPTPVPTPTPAPTPVPAPGGSHAPRPDEPYLKRPMAGSDAVREMQRLLIQLGMGQLASTGATGNFYSITQEAVRQFQTLVQSKYDGSMAVDGECGPVTWGWLLYLTGNG